MSSDFPSKRIRINDDDDDDDDDHYDYDATTKTQVFKLVSTSGFVDTKQLGKLLLLTSKAMTAAAFEKPDDVWKHLLFQKWSHARAMELLQSTGWSAEKCFRHFATKACTTDKDRFQGLRPLKYKPEDYLIIVTLKDNVNDLDVCKTIRGSEVPDFFEKGEAKVYFESPLWVGTVLEEEGLYYDRFTNVNIMRAPDNKYACVGDYGEEGHDGLEEDNCSDFCSGWMNYRCSLGAHSSYGSSFMKHFFEDYRDLCVHVDPEYRVVKGTTGKHHTVEIFGLLLRARLLTTCDCCCCHHDEEDLSDALRPDRCKGVTFAHILEASDDFGN